MGISTSLKYLRKELELTQKELAEKTGLSLSSIVSYENGLREPNSKALAKLEGFFQVSGEYLLGEIELDTYNKNKDDMIKELFEFSSLFKDFRDQYHFFTNENQAIALKALNVLYNHLLKMISWNENQKIHSDLPDELSEILLILSKLNHEGRKEYIKRGNEFTEISKYTNE